MVSGHMKSCLKNAEQKGPQKAKNGKGLAFECSTFGEYIEKEKDAGAVGSEGWLDLMV